MWTFSNLFSPRLATFGHFVMGLGVLPGSEGYLPSTRHYAQGLTIFGNATFRQNKTKAQFQEKIADGQICLLTVTCATRHSNHVPRPSRHLCFWNKSVATRLLLNTPDDYAVNFCTLKPCSSVMKRHLPRLDAPPRGRDETSLLTNYQIYLADTDCDKSSRKWTLTSVYNHKI